MLTLMNMSQCHRFYAMAQIFITEMNTLSQYLISLQQFFNFYFTSLYHIYTFNKYFYTKYMLVLPTQKIPLQLTQHIKQSSLKTPTRKMINGYRNKLITSLPDNNLQWVLINNSNYCAQAFCYQLNIDIYAQNDSQDYKKLQNIKKYQNQYEKIQVVSGNYIVVCKKDKEKQVDLFDIKSKGKLTEEQINKILQDITLSNTDTNADADKVVVRNILINNFDSFQQLKQCGLQSLLNQNQHKQVNKDHQKDNDKVKNFVGSKLFQVPVYFTQNGVWGTEHTYKLKIQGKNKKQQKQGQGQAEVQAVEQEVKQKVEENNNKA